MIRARGGLANRLRVVLSRFPGPVVWEPHHECCNAGFLDVFEPVDGLTVLTHGSGVETTDPDRQWSHHLSKVRPRPEIQSRIDALKASMGSYDAMHMRRTDHVENAKASGRYTPTEDFVRYALSCEGPMYLATDNGRTQRDMAELLGSRLVIGSHISDLGDGHKGGDGVRHTTLADAVVDAWVCAGARRFMGSGESSFSDLIQLLRVKGNAH